jgi:cellobiose epimerase
MHILEALTTLYEAWPDPVVRDRLTEMLNFLNKTMIDPKGYLIQYFYGDWQRVPGSAMKEKTGSEHWLGEPVTFGHDIELAYLLLDAAEALGWNDSTVMPTCIKLTEHTIKYGIDPIHGGIFNEGSHVTADSVIIIDDHKSWWAEFEALNSYLLMSQKVPSEKDRYYDLFLRQWEYIDQYVVDHEYGEFFNNGTDTDPRAIKMLKAHAWKAPYHTTRGLLNCIKNLNQEGKM